MKIHPFEKISPFDYIRMCSENYKVKCNHCKFKIPYTLMAMSTMKWHMETAHKEKAEWLKEEAKKKK